MILGLEGVGALYSGGRVGATVRGLARRVVRDDDVEEREVLVRGVPTERVRGRIRLDPTPPVRLGGGELPDLPDDVKVGRNHVLERTEIDHDLADPWVCDLEPVVLGREALDGGGHGPRA